MRRIAQSHCGTSRCLLSFSMTRLGLLPLLLLLCLRTAGSAALPPADQAQADPLLNVVSKQPLTEYLERQGALNDTLLVFKHDVVIRLTGTPFVPFDIEVQHDVVRGIREILFPGGPAELRTYKEVTPDPGAPDSGETEVPAVDLAITWYWVRKISQATGGVEANEAWGPTGALVWLTWDNLSRRLQAHWPGVPPPKVLFVNMRPGKLQGGYILHPLVVLTCQLGVSLEGSSPGGGLLSPQQASVVAEVVETAVVGDIATLVEIVEFKSTATGAAASLAENQRVLELEITMYVCRNNASWPYPACEREVLEVALSRRLQAAAARQRLQAAGIQAVDVIVIRERQMPAAPANDNTSSTADQQKDWVPWHLDRIDQHSLPLDGKYTPTATGSGVNVYILSSGIKAGHDEFGYLDGSPGTRVKPAWGYLGLKPLEDCPDSSMWFGYGTYVSSLCCGRRLGPARNATIQSVRFIDKCISDPLIFQAGGLPPALDLVFERPAVVLIDTWWDTKRTIEANAEGIYEELTMRLDRLQDANITVVVAAGPEYYVGDPCDSVFASHPGVISVAASDTHDQVTAFGPKNSSCITIWAPSSGLGSGVIGAGTAGNSNYTRVIDRAFGAAAIVAGVAAQYLELHPDASPAEVKAALQGMATQDALAGTGPASPNLLLFTNLSSPQAGSAAGEPLPGGSSGDSSSGGLAAGVIAAIAVAAALGLSAVGGGLWVMMRRRRRLASGPSPPKLGKLSDSGWEIGCGEIEICRRPDGSEWLLGEGRCGKVYKALKGGVQVVAVKKLNDVTDHLKALFVEEAGMMKYVSRDPSIAQFYGAVMNGDDMMLVVEYMEGGDLRDALSSDRTRAWQWYNQGKEVMLDIVRGVAFLHANHVIHRDIKSKNVLLGRDGRAKVTDVGLAQLLGDDQDPSKAGGLAGTLAWAAPEVLLGEKVTEKSDVYSLGVVLWELVTESVPQRGRLMELEVPQQCPQGVADAVQACMQRDPALRPSARELYARLLACANSPSACSNKTPSTYTTGSTSSRSSSWLPSFSSESSARSSTAAISFEKLEFCTKPGGSPEKLGSGSFGVVYKALLDGVQALAVKTVQLGDDPSVQQGFLREAGILWQLRHTNIVALSGVSVSEGRGFLLMEFMEGGSLHANLNMESSGHGQRVFGWYNRGKQVALDIARGLHYLHSMRVTHFDLKSANILLTQDFTAKVADVGLSREMTCSHHSLSFETSGPPGTLAYMAPELIVGSKCTQSVDVYSYGILLKEICTGTHPVRGHACELRVPEDCPQAVADLCARCMAAEPERRPTARELVERLSLISQSRQDLAEEPNATEPSTNGARGQADASPAKEAQPAPRLPGPPAEMMVSPWQAMRSLPFNKQPLP